MRRETAIRYALTIAERIKKYHGVFCTPLMNRDCVRIKRVWLFGSTVKGSHNPNDVDILIEYGHGGRHFTERKDRASVMKRRKRDCFGGVWWKNSRDEVLRELRNGLRMVRFHDYEIDGEIAYPRIMLYPRNDLCRD